MHSGCSKSSLSRNANIKNVPLNVEDILNQWILCIIIGLPSNKFLDSKTILCQFTSLKQKAAFMEIYDKIRPHFLITLPGDFSLWTGKEK